MAGKILIVDDVATNRIVLRVKLAAACYDTLQAASGAEALETARTGAPDLILLDLMLPDTDGISVCRALKADARTRDIPVIMITALNDPAARCDALTAGADDYLSKPLDELTLLARLRSLLRARETAEELRLRDMTCRELGFAEPAVTFEAPGTIAVVAGDARLAAARIAALQGLLPDRLVPVARTDALADHPPAATPDAFLIAVDLARPGDGLRLMSELRSRPSTRHAAICLVLAPGGGDTAAMALDLGANDLVPEDADPQELALRLSTMMRRKRQSDRLRARLHDGLRLSVTDPLTGLYNRRYALPHLAGLDARARESGRGYAVMLLDLDRFKRVNDTHGHAAGDAVLVALAGRLRDNLRAGDMVARIGGEEFLVAIPDTSLAEARAAAERLRRVIEAQTIELPGGRGALAITVSIGLAIGPAEGRCADDLLECADAALLIAKSDGRNQVTIGQLAA